MPIYIFAGGYTDTISHHFLGGSHQLKVRTYCTKKISLFFFLLIRVDNFCVGCSLSRLLDLNIHCELF